MKAEEAAAAMALSSFMGFCLVELEAVWMWPVRLQSMQMGRRVGIFLISVAAVGSGGEKGGGRGRRAVSGDSWMAWAALAAVAGPWGCQTASNGGRGSGRCGGGGKGGGGGQLCCWCRRTVSSDSWTAGAAVAGAYIWLLWRAKILEGRHVAHL